MVKIKSNKKNIFIKTITIVILIFVWFSIFINYEFYDVSFEQLIFTLTNPVGANYEIVFTGTLFVLVGTIVTIILYQLFIKLWRSLKLSVVFKFSFKDKIFKLDIFKVNKFRFIVLYLVFVFCSIYLSVSLIELDDYIINMNNYSTIFEDYYVDSEEVNITFPKNKKNLIFIVVESLESGNVSKDNGGISIESYTPNLEKLALKNINFSSTDMIGGFNQVSNTSYTMTGLLSLTSGIPLKIPVDWNVYKSKRESLPGVYSIGEILEDNDYRNYFMLGSDANYGGRRQYFEQHGNYEIMDYYWAIDEGKIDKDYHVWWGYEDLKLFDYAEEELLKISKKDEPFNFTLLTADTHFTDGYMDDSCEIKFDNKYANAFYCADSKLGKFVSWIKKQDFYDDTVIVIVGDHLVCQEGLYKNDETNRYVYNVIINSDIKTDNNKNRQVSHFDMMPTTLAAMGATIEGERLGLGVNLFSDKKTLIERFGIDYVNEKLLKKSVYYNDKIIGDSYYDMMNDKELLD